MQEILTERDTRLTQRCRNGSTVLTEHLGAFEKVITRISDIVENPKKLKFLPNVEAALLPQMYNNDEGDAVVINANYAIDAGLDPVKDPIAVESGENNPYANIITVHRGDEKKKDIVALVDVLHSKEIQDWIRTKYKGAVIPVNN